MSRHWFVPVETHVCYRSGECRGTGKFLGWTYQGREVVEEPKFSFVMSPRVNCDSHAPRDLRFLFKKQMSGMHSRNSYPHRNSGMTRQGQRSKICSEPTLESLPSGGSNLIWFFTRVSPYPHAQPPNHEIRGLKSSSSSQEIKVTPWGASPKWRFTATAVKDGWGWGCFSYKLPFTLCSISSSFPYFFLIPEVAGALLIPATSCGQNKWQGSSPAQKILCCNQDIMSFI